MHACIPYTLYPIPYTLYPIPYTVPYTLYHIPTIHTVPYHSIPYRATSHTCEGIDMFAFNWSHCKMLTCPLTKHTCIHSVKVRLLPAVASCCQLLPAVATNCPLLKFWNQNYRTCPDGFSMALPWRQPCMALLMFAKRKRLKRLQATPRTSTPRCQTWALKSLAWLEGKKRSFAALAGHGTSCDMG